MGDFNSDPIVHADLERVQEHKDTPYSPQVNPPEIKDSNELNQPIRPINKKSLKIRKLLKPDIFKRYIRRQVKIASLRNSVGNSENGNHVEKSEVTGSDLPPKADGMEEEISNLESMSCDQSKVSFPEFQSPDLQQAPAAERPLHMLESEFSEAGNNGDIGAGDVSLSSHKLPNGGDNLISEEKISEEVGSNKPENSDQSMAIEEAKREEPNCETHPQQEKETTIFPFMAPDTIKNEENETTCFAGSDFIGNNIEIVLDSKELENTTPQPPIDSSAFEKQPEPISNEEVVQAPKPPKKETKTKQKKKPGRPKLEAAKTQNKSGGPVLEAPEAFELIFDSNLLKFLLGEVNARHTVEIEKYAQNSHHRKWTEVTEIDLRQFIGLILFMAIDRKDKVNDYWTVTPSEDKFSIRKLMSRERFQQIFKCFPGIVRKEKDRSETEALINRFLGVILENSRKNYASSKDLTVGCCTVTFRAESGSNLSKLLSSKFKACMATEAATGFMMSCLVHNVKEEEGNLSSVGEIVARVLSPFEGQDFSAYMSADYSTGNLFHQLLEKGIKACGKIAVEHLELPGIVSSKIAALEENGCRKYTFNSMALGVWKFEKETLYVLSTVHYPCKLFDNMEVKQNSTLETMRIDYNENIDGVDKFIEMMSPYSNGQRNSTTYTPLENLYFLLEITMINSYIIYTKKMKEAGKGEILSQKDFRLKVIEHLFGGTELAVELTSKLKPDNTKKLAKEFFVEKEDEECCLVTNKKPKVCSICNRKFTKKGAKKLHTFQKFYVTFCLKKPS